MSATNNAQGWSRAGAGEAPVSGGLWPATVAVHQNQVPARQYLPHRANCRSVTARLSYPIALGGLPPDAHRRVSFCPLRATRRQFKLGVMAPSRQLCLPKHGAV